MIKKIKKIGEKFELTAIAVTFAEAGEWTTAKNYLDKLKALDASEKPKLVVVALDSDFSDETIDYTVNFADRMKYDVLALNVFQSRRSKKNIQSGSDIGAVSRSNNVLKSLMEKTKERNIRCEFIIAAEELRTLINKIQKIIRHIEIMLLQLNKGQKVSLNVDIPVYRIIAENV